MDTLGGEAILAWQTWESKSFFKDLFLFKTKSNSFEIKSISFFKILLSLKIESTFEDKTSLFFNTSSQSFLFFKNSFSFKASSSWDLSESHSLATLTSLATLIQN